MKNEAKWGQNVFLGFHPNAVQGFPCIKMTLTCKFSLVFMFFTKTIRVFFYKWKIIFTIVNLYLQKISVNLIFFNKSNWTDSFFLLCIFLYPSLLKTCLYQHNHLEDQILSRDFRIIQKWCQENLGFFNTAPLCYSDLPYTLFHWWVRWKSFSVVFKRGLILFFLK